MLLFILRKNEQNTGLCVILHGEYNPFANPKQKQCLSQKTSNSHRKKQLF